jgi:predicted RNase H-like HicB family nuclease
MPERVITVLAFFDAEARVWVAESEDVPGLITEADSVEQLIAKLHVMIPELLEENDGDLDLAEIPFSVMLQNLHARRGPDT